MPFLHTGAPPHTAGGLFFQSLPLHTEVKKGKLEYKKLD